MNYVIGDIVRNRDMEPPWELAVVHEISRREFWPAGKKQPFHRLLLHVHCLDPSVTISRAWWDTSVEKVDETQANLLRLGLMT